MGDGSVHFINESIDVGDITAGEVSGQSNQPSGGVSPYGVWGALGSRSGSEPDSIPD